MKKHMQLMIEGLQDRVDGLPDQPWLSREQEIEALSELTDLIRDLRSIRDRELDRADEELNLSDDEAASAAGVQRRTVVRRRERGRTASGRGLVH